jgi:ABC-type glutathione transport system ATPase component
MPEHDLIVEVAEVRKSFSVRSGHRRQLVTALDGVSFDVPRGTSMAIVGESGSGKTTLARIMLGLERADEGAVRVAGRDFSRPPRGTRDRRARARVLQIVFQDPSRSLDPKQTVASCIDEVLRLQTDRSAKERAVRVAELAELVGLDERQTRALPANLSGGQRQRVAIARALATGPEILILDEAVASLDVSIQAQILNLLMDIREATGITYLFISHDLAVVRQVTSEAIVMQCGTIVERGPTRQILERPEHPYTKLLLDSVPRRGWKPSRALDQTEAARVA